YVTLGAQGRLHDLERREGHVALLLDQAAPQLHPGGLDGKRLRTPDVAQLAGRTGEERVNHHLAHVLLSLDVFTQEEPLAPRRLTLPAATVELVALVDAVAALRAGVCVLDDVRRDAAPLAMRAFARLRLHVVRREPDYRLERLRHAHGSRQEPSPQHLAGIHHPARVGIALEPLQARERFPTQYLARLVA